MTRLVHRRRIAAVALALGAVLPACGISTDNGPRDIVVAARDDNPGINPQTEITATNTSVIYLLDGSAPAASGMLLTPISRDVAETIDNALAALFAGPTIREANSDLLTAIPSRVRLFGAVPNGDVVTVDISDAMDELTPPQRIAAVGQIVLTAAGVAGVTGVVITVVGTDRPWPKADGTSTTDPLTRDDFAALLPAGTGDTPPVTSNPISTSIGASSAT